MGKHRERLEIIADILHTVEDGARKTHVMYQANLSYALLRRYLCELVDVGFVHQAGSNYFLTESGVMFLDMFADYTASCGKLNADLRNIKDMKVVLDSMLIGDLKDSL